MNPPIRSITPETPRSDEKTASANATNRTVISTVSSFRLMRIPKNFFRDSSRPLALDVVGPAQ